MMLVIIFCMVDAWRLTALISVLPFWNYGCYFFSMWKNYGHGKCHSIIGYNNTRVHECVSTWVVNHYCISSHTPPAQICHLASFVTSRHTPQAVQICHKSMSKNLSLVVSKHTSRRKTPHERNFFSGGCVVFRVV